MESVIPPVTRIARSWFRKVDQLVPELRRALLLGALYTGAVECLKLGPPYLLKTVIDQLGKHAPLAQVLWGVAGTFGISILTTAVEQRYGLFTAHQAFKVEAELLRSGQAKLLGLGLAYHEDHPSGDLIQLLTKGAGHLRELLWFTLDQFLGASLQIVFTSIVLLFIHPGCGLVFIAFLPIVLVQVHRGSRKLQPFRERYHAVFRQASWEMNQSLTNVRTVMDFVQERREASHFKTSLAHYLGFAGERIRAENTDHRSWDLLLGSARFAVLLYAVYLVHADAMTTGSLFLLATLSEKVVASLFRLSRLYSYLGDSIESVEQLTDMFAEQPSIVERPSAESCIKLDGAIELDEVGFAYLSGRPVLQDVSLTIPARSMTAVVGRSGAGKTTLIKLLSRHYDVTEGALRVDGVDVRDYALADYRRQVAVVSQDIQLFDTTIARNIAYGRDATLEEIREAARLANADQFVSQLPNGYDTAIGERGVKLSGGQRQRVGIARALLMRPAVLVFDEATSSLDTESERLIQEALAKIARQQTMIIIAHRLSTVESADHIVVLENGRIAEHGSPAQLTQRDGVFARMRRLQGLDAQALRA